jgi:hypothetical protein
LEKLTVRNGAIQTHVTGTQNWAAIKAPGKDVTLEAIISPAVTGADDLIHWAGATPDPSNKRLAKVSRSQAQKISVSAEVGKTKDSLEVWIIWVELRLRTSELTTPTNSAVFPAGLIFPRLGTFADEDFFNEGFNQQEAAAQVEIVGKLTPAGVYQVVKSGWAIERTVERIECKNGTLQPVLSQPDDSFPQYQDLTPESDDNIFDIDSPTIGVNFQVNHTAEAYKNFEQLAKWNGEQASDPMVWHYFARIDDDKDLVHWPRNRDTDLNEVGEGGANATRTCYYTKRP